MPSSGPIPPRPPSPAMAALGNALLLALAPRLDRPASGGTDTVVPTHLGPWSEHLIPRARGRHGLSARRFPVHRGAPRGVVLLVHPWVPWGSAYFFRRGRLEALRAASYEAWTLDLPGFGASGPRRGFFDLELASALDWLAAHAPDTPLHVWGVSSGGYWLHPVLSKSRGHEHRVRAAVFEDVASHLLRWSWRVAPWGRPFYLIYRGFLRSPYRFLDMHLHAQARGVGTVTYVSGALDPGVPASDTETFAQAAGGRALIIPDAGHLASIKVANREVIAAALATFAAAG